LQKLDPALDKTWGSSYLDLGEIWKGHRYFFLVAFGFHVEIFVVTPCRFEGKEAQTRKRLFDRDLVVVVNQDYQLLSRFMLLIKETYFLSLFVKCEVSAA